MKNKWFFLLIALTSSIFFSCNTSPLTEVSSELDNLKGPEVSLDSSFVENNAPKACAVIEKLRISNNFEETVATKSGIIKDDFEAIRKVLRGLQVTVSFRDTNLSCAPHLAAGVESKGHDVMSKTFMDANLPEHAKHLAGTVSTLNEKPEQSHILKDPYSLVYLNDEGKPLTCDYDMMDMISKDGKRIKGESNEDLNIRNEINKELPLRGNPPHRVDRIKHGAQAGYLDFLRDHEKHKHSEKPVKILLKPEAPLTVFEYDGRVLRLPTLEMVLNYYNCNGIPILPEWNIKLTNRLN